MPRVGTVVVVVVLAAIAAGGASAQPPPPPAAYYGSLTAAGEPAPAGVTITAEIDGEVRGKLTTTSAGSYGGAGAFDPKLQVNGTAEDDGATVTFYVNGIQATPTVEWRSGDIRRVDLTVDEDLSPPDDGGGTGGDGGPSGDPGSPGTPDTESPGNESASNATATTEITVNGTEAGTEISVTNARANTTVSVDLISPDSPPSNDSDQDFQLEVVNVTTRQDTDFTLSITQQVDPPTGAPAFDETDDPPIGYIEVDHSIPDEDIGEVAFQFRVRTDRLDDRNIAPEDVVLYRHHDGEWTALETTLVSSTDSHYRLRADSPGLSVFAIGSRGSADEPTLSVVEAALSDSRIEVGQVAEVTATVENQGSSSATATIALYVDGDVVDTIDVTVPAGESTTVRFESPFDGPGTHDIRVEETAAGRLVVEPASTPVDDSTTPRQTGHGTPLVTAASDDSEPASGDGLLPVTGQSDGAGFIALVASVLVTLAVGAYYFRSRRKF